MPVPEPHAILVPPGSAASNGGWTCFILAMLFMILPFPTAFIWAPFLLVAFILAIVAIAAGRRASGISLLIVVLVGSPIVWIFAFVFYAATAATTAFHVAKAMAPATNFGPPAITRPVSVSVPVTNQPPDDRAVQDRIENIRAQRLAEAAAAFAHKEQADLATFKHYLERAQAGDAHSQFRLSQLYANGIGCPTNTAEARSWLLKAAVNGDEAAKRALQ
jgi:energy-coupling factor transporter transmembrane protein EcfT